MAWGKGDNIAARIGAQEAARKRLEEAQAAQRRARQETFEELGMTQELREFYRGQAIATYAHRITATRGSLGTHVGCIMFYNSGGQLLHNIATSGAVSEDRLPALRGVRLKAHVALDKATICAEERLLVFYPRPADNPYLFSLAFNETQLLRACNNGMRHDMGSSNCTSILRSSGIEDLAHSLL